MRFTFQSSTVSANPLDFVVLSPCFLSSGVTLDYWWQKSYLDSWLALSDIPDEVCDIFANELKATAARTLDINPDSFREV